MPARLFFLLLNEMYKIQAGDNLEQIAIVAVPHMEKQAAKEVIDSYRLASSDIMDLTEVNDDFSALDKLKAKLHG